MNEYPNTVKHRLTTIITQMSNNPSLYVKNAQSDFTRKRKLPFETMIHFLLSMGGNSIYKELLETQGYDANTATTSAFIQQRDKILPFAFEYLFREFTDTIIQLQKYKGYRLLAVDGSGLHTATNPDDQDTYIQNNPDDKGYNLLQLNALYDLCNRLYIDTHIQPRRGFNEHKALTKMVDRSNIHGRVIVIADRGYESYNNFAHIEKKGWSYLIRVKDLGSNGILSGLNMPTCGEFDIRVKRILTRKQTKEVKASPDIYRFLPSNVNFDFLDLHTDALYPIAFRAVRFKIADGCYETVITNLDETDFPPSELKTLYAKRWGIETSFRELKYAVGLVNFHAKKQEYIVQEIFARLIMYNFAEMITSYVVIQHTDTKLFYQVNFTVAIHICRHFLRCIGDILSPDVEALIRKNILPIRPNRVNKRNIWNKTAVSFIYRIA
jgi:hypothetical protein